MESIDHIPEIAALGGSTSCIRLPEQIDVPITARVRRLIDSPSFQRLKSISQLGFVSTVYPGATHSRFEHSLGVYRLALLFINQLKQDQRFRQRVSRRDAELLIVSALLHDIAHWPFCHPIEDLCLEGVPQHEDIAADHLHTPEISDALSEDWQIDWRDVHALLTKQTRSTSHEILSSILAGPIDVDKMDYLYRDSLHAGVPYGRNFDVPRLIGSLCLNEAGNGIAITSKGKTAAELMVFARYVMFSEVYWHHAVRSATAMFQRAFYLLKEDLKCADLGALFRCRENEIAGVMNVLDREKKGEQLLEGLFGSSRNLYKQWCQFGFSENKSLHEKIARQPYENLFQISRRLSEKLHDKLKTEINCNDILLDAPPMGLEVQFNVEVFESKKQRYRPLGEVSPVVNTLASNQFDNFVKQVRLFVHPRIAAIVKPLDGIVLVESCL